jgi:DNA modification methylase
MESCTIQLTPAAHKHGNLNIRSCGRDFFPPDVFGGSSKKKGLGVLITIKAQGLPQPIQTDIPTDAKTGKPRWIFRERSWVKNFIHLNRLTQGGAITIERLNDRTYKVISDNNHNEKSQINGVVEGKKASVQNTFEGLKGEQITTKQGTNRETLTKIGYNRAMNRELLSKQVSKESIDKLKNNTEAFYSFLHNQTDGMIVSVLKKMGRLENGYSRNPLLNLLKNSNENIRLLAIKNLAKIGDVSLLSTFVKYAHSDESTMVRREAVSAIGRLRNEKTISILIEILKDTDPKVVMQAIRGLLVFSQRDEVKKKLKKLIDHPNEIIKEVINKELNGFQNKSNNSQKHDKFPIFLRNTVVNGDVIEVLKHVPDESVHLTFTSPPYYNARDYSIYQSYEEYLNFLERVFKEVHRISKEGRFFVLNTSPIIIQRLSRAYASKRYSIPYDIHPLLIKMGWEFIDDIVWVKPEASVKNRNAGFLQHRKPLAYKPNAVSEMLMVYRKKTDKLIDWNIKQYSWEKVKKSKVVDGYETTNIWRIDPTFDRVHSAVFPLELCNRVIKFYSFIGDLIFDPFAGSGTLGRAAINLNRNFFLTEKESKYINRIKEELNKSNNLFNLKDGRPNFVGIETFISQSKAKL